jgi:type IV pilus assembly protein PilM
VFKRFSFFHRSTIGLDISPLCVKAIQMSKTAEECWVEQVRCESLPNHAIIDNQIRDLEAVTACIKALLSKANFSAKWAVLALPNSIIVSKVIQISNRVHEAEIEELVLLEASKAFSYSIHEINLDFIIQGPSLVKKDHLDVLVLACRADQINRRIEAVTQAGLIPKVVEMESNAIERILPWLSDPSSQGKEKSIALFNLNALSATLHVIKGQKTIFSYEESFNTAHWSKNITQAYEQFSAGMSLQLNPLLQHTVQGEQVPPEMMLRQIKKMLQFFLSAHISPIEYILLSGELLSINFAQSVQDRLGILTAIANPFYRFKWATTAIDLKSTSQASSFVLACGLALRELIKHE